MKYKAVISFVGDLFPANMGYNNGFGVGSSFLKHHGDIWEENIKKIFDNSDLVFANLESPLIYNSEIVDKKTFAGDSIFANFLKKNKIEIVSIANNHILEHGIEGFNSTCEILEKNLIKYIGVFNNNTSNIQIITINGISFGFSAFNDIEDIENPNLYADLENELLLNTINELNKLNLDYKIISLHWGHEYCHYPSLDQVMLAHKMIDLGINIVIGHHTHVIQPVEEYNNGLIFYSLGNFLFDMLWSKKVRSGLVAEIMFEKNNFTYNLSGIYLTNNYGSILNESITTKILNLNKKFEHKLSKFYKTGKYKNPNFRLNRNIQRVLMKKEILKNWNKISSVSKQIIFNKLFKL